MDISRRQALGLLGSVALAPAAALGTRAEGEARAVALSMTEADLFAALDPSVTGVSAAMSRFAAGDLPAARQELAAHMRRRQRPVFPEHRFPSVETDAMALLYPGGPGPYASGAADSFASRPLRTPGSTATSDAILQHTFTCNNNTSGEAETYSLGPHIDWTENPSAARSWLLYLNQLNCLAVLAGDYQATGDDRYAAKVGDLVISWIEQCSADYQGFMQARNRGMNCLAAYEAVRSSPALVPQAHVAVLRLLAATCRLLAGMPDDGSVTYSGLIPMAVMLPELAESRQWLAAGIDNLRAVNFRRSTPDGAWDCHSVDYHGVPIQWAARTLEFLEADADTPETERLAEEVRDQNRRMIAQILWLVLPNGGTPNIGDVYGRCDWDTRYRDRHIRWYLHYVEPKAKRRLEQIEDPWERTLSVLAHIEGTEGGRPRRTSVGFAHSGYYVMRSGWEPLEASYLYFDVSPQARSHAHFDLCAFELYAFGKPLLCDTGDYFLGYGERTKLHNAVEVDGQGQRWGDRPIPCEWTTTAALDVVDGASTAFGEQGCRHRRKVVFLKPDYWVLFDLLSGSGEHCVEQYFHFAPVDLSRATAVETDAVARTCRTRSPGVANLVIAPADPGALDFRFAQRPTFHAPPQPSQDESLQGWFVPGMLQKLESPVGVYGRRATLPFALDTVLFPVPPQGEATVAVRRLSVLQDGQPVAPHRASGLQIEVCLTGPDRSGERYTDLLLLSHDGPCRRQYGPYAFDGEVAWVRLEADGALARLAVHNGGSLREGDRLLVQGDMRIVDAAAVWDGDVVWLSGSKVWGLKLAAGRARRVLAEADGLRSVLRGETLATSPAPRDGVPAITALSGEAVPPQPGLAGAQPGIRVAWRTDRPTWGRVFCQGPDGALQRSFVSATAATDHRLELPHLVPCTRYRLRAVAWDEYGSLAESAEVHVSTEP
ncbi:MAG: alginate lyase family protein [Candidatus Latescibacterota bacterium]